MPPSSTSTTTITPRTPRASTSSPSPPRPSTSRPIGSSASSAGAYRPPAPPAPLTPPPERRIPVTPGLLRAIFASSRSPLEERSVSRVAFFRFAGFVLSCVAISLAAARGRSLKSGAAGLLGVV